MPTSSLAPPIHTGCSCPSHLPKSPICQNSPFTGLTPAGSVPCPAALFGRFPLAVAGKHGLFPVCSSWPSAQMPFLLVCQTNSKTAFDSGISSFLMKSSVPSPLRAPVVQYRRRLWERQGTWVCWRHVFLSHQTMNISRSGTDSEFSLPLSTEERLRNVCSWRGGWMDK